MILVNFFDEKYSRKIIKIIEIWDLPVEVSFLGSSS